MIAPIPATERESMSRSGLHCSAEEPQTLCNPDSRREIHELLRLLYHIIDRLEALFPSRRFTPDGHLVGSIGEVLPAYMFDLGLLPGPFHRHDAVAIDGRKVQLKFTQGTKTVAFRMELDHLCLAPENRSLEAVYKAKR